MNYVYPQGNPNVFEWVPDENYVQNYRMMPNTVGAFVDYSGKIFWMKSTDNVGRPSSVEKRYLVTEEEYKKLQNEVEKSETKYYVTKDELKEALASLDSKYEFRKGKKNNG